MLGPGGRGGGWVNFLWVCAAGLSESLPLYSLFYVQSNYILMGKYKFSDPNLVTFCLCKNFT